MKSQLMRWSGIRLHDDLQAIPNEITTYEEIKQFYVLLNMRHVCLNHVVFKIYTYIYLWYI